MIASIAIALATAAASAPWPDKPVPAPKQPAVPAIAKCNGSAVLQVAPGGTGDGALLRPLPSVQAAIAAARERALCSVDIRVAPGTYDDTEPLAIDRATKLLGPTSGRAVLRAGVTSTGPWTLELHRLTFEDTPGPAVDVDDDRAHTVLRNLLVRRAERFGVRQRGGRLDARTLTVTHTTVASKSGTGIAIDLSGGTRAELSRLLLADNAGQAIALRGDGTHAVVIDAQVVGTGQHPAVAEQLAEYATHPSDRGIGAVAATARATLMARDLRIERSRVTALYVAGGARARAESLVIDDVAALPGAYGGGFGVVVRDAAVAELRAFEIGGVAFAGLSASGGLLRADDGRVTRAPLGLLFAPPTEPAAYSVDCILAGTFFDPESVGRPLQAASYSLPAGLTAGDAGASWLDGCPHVAWDPV